MDDLETGRVGEEKAKQILNKSAQTKILMDVSDDPYFQQLDIDLLQLRPNGTVLKYEVKTDTQAHRTGNLAYEILTSTNEGCLAKTHANYILYYLTGSDEMYGFWTQTMREYIDFEKSKLKMTLMGDCAVGYLLKIEELVKLGIIQKMEV